MIFRSISFIVVSACAFSVVLPGGRTRADAPTEPKHTIAEVMRDVMKKGQWKKLASGEASKEDADKLVALFEDLARNQPSHGTAKSWEEKTQVIFKAAQAAAKHEEGAGDRLKKAIDCRSCHQAHKS